MSMYHIASLTSASNFEPVLSNIPQNFKHLHIRVVGRSPASAVGTTAGFNSNFDAPYFRINGDSTSANYTVHTTYGDGATSTTGAISQTLTAMVYGVMPVNSFASQIFGTTIVDILDYSSTNKYKSVRSIAACDTNGSGIVTIRSGLWLSNSAINQIYFGGTTSGLLAGSRIDVYGVSNSTVTGV